MPPVWECLACLFRLKAMKRPPACPRCGKKTHEKGAEAAKPAPAPVVKWNDAPGGENGTEA